MKPRGIRLNNPLNIRHNRNNRWQGIYDPQDDPDFVHFSTMQFGIRAGFVILKGYIGKGFCTPERIIQRWAPSHENPTDTYIDYVCKRTGLTRHHVIHFGNEKEMVALVEAMIKFETGWTVNVTVIQQGYAMV